MKIHKGELLIDAEVKTLNGKKTTLEWLCQGKKTALYFMRDSACILCQHEVQKLMDAYGRISDAGAQVVVVVQSTPKIAGTVLDVEKLPFPVVCDAEGRIYDLYGAGEAKSRETMSSPEIEEKIAAAKNAGFIHGKDVGSPLRIPYTVIFNEKMSVESVYEGKYADDVIPVSDMLHRLSCI